MTEAFDPYHRWLGIPPDEQPADHYRLLGLARYEEDPEVIRDAAERQMAHVRLYALGKYSDLSQHVLNELGAAKACLLDRLKKSEYDEHLRHTEAAAKKRPPVPAARKDEPVESAAAPRRASVVPSALPPPPPAIRSDSSMANAVGAGDQIVVAPLLLPVDSNRMRPQVLVGIAVGAVSVVVLCLLLWYGLGDHGQGKPPATQETAGTVEPPQDAAKAPQDSSPSKSALAGPAPSMLRLGALADREVARGEKLRFLVPVAMSSELEGKLTFRLGPGSPAGAAIDPQSGMFTWMPGAQEKPGKHPVVVEVSAPGNLRDTGAFQVNVARGNRLPVIQPIENQIVEPGRTLTLQIRASDPDQDRLSFTAVEKPPGAHLDAISGTFTWTPEASQADASHPVIVRVTDDGPGAFSVERAFAINVAAREQAPIVMPWQNAASSNAAFHIELPSGKSLRSADFEIQQQVKNEAKNLLEMFLSYNLDVVVLFADEGRRSIAALCSCNVAKKGPNGVTVAFHENADPATCYVRQLRRGVLAAVPANAAGNLRNAGPRLAANPRPAAPDTAFWEEVVPKLYVTYNRAAKWDGWLATWDESGRKHFWCQYSSGERHGLCCLFRQDQLKMVLECTDGAVQAVHLISNNRVLKSFAKTEEASEDGEAGAALKEITDLETRLRDNEDAFRKNVKQAIMARTAMINQMRKAESEARRAHREREQQRRTQAFRDFVLGRK